jgi:transcriptional regulator with GAF, ATPase, and Fis domain
LNEKKFIEEITHTLYTRLDAEQVIYDAFVLIREYFPADNFHMGIFNRSEKELRYFASATLSGGNIVDERVKLDKEAETELKRFVVNKATITNNSTKSPIIQSVVKNHRELVSDTIFKIDKPFSTITLTPLISEFHAGCFSIVSLEPEMYTSFHARLFEKIARPLTNALLNMIHHKDILNKNQILIQLNKNLSKRLGHEGQKIIGRNKDLKEIDFLVNQVAPLSSPVLITGETGTGKELIAHEIHRLSKRQSEPMVCVNCGAIPENLIESELFGYEKGAFTGAFSTKRGYFEQADKGTVFLDELGELSLSAQVKLLRIIQEKKFRRVGGTREISADVRIIAATNSNLLGLVKNKKFREDLYFRLNVFPLHIPPLRTRKRDILDLFYYFLSEKCKELHIDEIPEIDEVSINNILSYSWPGNIRELMNIIERKLITSGGKNISFFDLKKTGEIQKDAKISDNSFKTLDDVITGHIRQALEITKGKIEGKDGAAKLLGLNPSTLRGKIRKYSIFIN